VQVYRRFAKAVEAGLARRVSAREHAARLGVSESTLERACKAVAGLTAKQFIGKRTVLEAKRLLLHSTYTMAGVGLSLGFEDATNFVKFFRHAEGVTPGAYR
jgi:AraC-like DNA-binding protein